MAINPNPDSSGDLVNEVELADKEVANQGFYRRYERWILPLVVMTVGLVVVSFGPLAVRLPVLQFIADWFAPAHAN